MKSLCSCFVRLAYIFARSMASPLHLADSPLIALQRSHFLKKFPIPLLQEGKIEKLAIFAILHPENSKIRVIFRTAACVGMQSLRPCPLNATCLVNDANHTITKRPCPRTQEQSRVPHTAVSLAIGRNSGCDLSPMSPNLSQRFRSPVAVLRE